MLRRRVDPRRGQRTAVIIQVLFVAAIVAAVIALGARRWRRSALRRAAAAQPGASEELAIYVRSYTEMDDHLAQRWCVCGGYLERTGEGSRDTSGRRLRIARLVCQECERRAEVFFDTTDVLH
jgi:hypothetical protein